MHFVVAKKHPIGDFHLFQFPLLSDGHIFDHTRIISDGSFEFTILVDHVGQPEVFRLSVVFDRSVSLRETSLRMFLAAAYFKQTTVPSSRVAMMPVLSMAKPLKASLVGNFFTQATLPSSRLIARTNPLSFS